MKKTLKFLLCVSVVVVLVVDFAISPLAHTQQAVWEYANKHTKQFAITNPGFQFAILGGPWAHANGNHINYFWANSTAQAHLQFATNDAFAISWYGMISGTETTAANAHVEIRYDPSIHPTAAATTSPRYGDSNGHFRQGVQNNANHSHDARITFYGNTANYTHLRKRQVMAHELGHLWGIDDIYDHCDISSCNCKSRDSIFSRSYAFSAATRHDRNALYIGLGNPWFEVSTGYFKRWESPGVFLSDNECDGHWFELDELWETRAFYRAKRLWSNTWHSGTQGSTAGTLGQPLERFEVTIGYNSFNSLPHGVGIRYDAHVSNVGWANGYRNGQTIGVSGQHIEAVRIYLDGLPDRSIWYRVYIHNTGTWTSWMRNGQIAGTTGQNMAIDAIQITF